MKAFNLACRHKIVYWYLVFLMSFLFIQLRFFLSNNNGYPTESLETLLISNQISSYLRRLPDGDGNNISNILFNSKETSKSAVDVNLSILPVPKSTETHYELHQLIERYSAEDKFLRMNTTFKRILFWNEVGLHNGSLKIMLWIHHC